MKSMIWKIIFLLLNIMISSCSKSSEECPESWRILENPRLDVIADDLANLKAKVSNGNGVEEDYRKITQLEAEEDAIWNAAKNSCR